MAGRRGVFIFLATNINNINGIFNYRTLRVRYIPYVPVLAERELRQREDPKKEANASRSVLPRE